MNAEEQEYMDYLIHNRMELTNQITRHLDRIDVLEKKLDIATKALKEYADEDAWGIDPTDPFYPRDVFVGGGFEIAYKALKEMEEVR